MQNTFFRAQHDLQEQYNTGKRNDIEIYGTTTNINHLRKHNEDERKSLGKRKEDAYELVKNKIKKICINRIFFVGL